MSYNVHQILEPSLPIEWTDTAEGPVLRVRGEIDAYTSGDLARALGPAVEEAPRQLRLDLAEVPFLDSSGVLVLVDARHRLARRGGELRIVGSSPAVRRVLSLLRLSSLFLEDALQWPAAR